MATLVVTYCSAEKDPGEQPMPAVDRYLSPRVRGCRDAANAAGTGFRILSGRYGLLAADEPIPWYDHLLTDDEVADRITGVSEQLRNLQPDRLILVSRSLDEDPQLEPYHELLRRAGAACGLPCEILSWDDGEDAVERLAASL